jgi:hypothetical protein
VGHPNLSNRGGGLLGSKWCRTSLPRSKEMGEFLDEALGEESEFSLWVGNCL